MLIHDGRVTPGKVKNSTTFGRCTQKGLQMRLAHQLDSDFDTEIEKPPVTEESKPHDPLVGSSLKRKMAIYASFTILTPALLSAVAVVDGVAHGFSTTAIGSLMVMYLITAIGITCGFHRHFAHKSYSVKTPLRIFLGIAGSMAAQGPVLNWASTHRRHHQNTDKPGDPHSPYVRGEKRFGRLAGFWHSHIGWMITDNMTNPVKYTPDLLRDKSVTFVNRYYLAWVALGVLAPGIACAILQGTWSGFVMGILWGGFVRLFLVHHAFWIIGSLAHIVGVRVFATTDQSRNNFFSAIVNFGEGWHNNHHAFSSSARFGLRWYQLDIGYLFISLMQTLGLAYDLRRPTAKQIEEKSIKRAKNAESVR